MSTDTVTEEMLREGIRVAKRIGYAVAARTHTTHYRDEYVGGALEALSKAALSYDPSTGVPWIAWAILKMHGGAWDEFRRWAGRGSKVRPNTVMTEQAALIYDEVLSRSFVTDDIAEDYNARFDLITVRDAIREAAQSLTDCQRDAMAAWLSGERGAMTKVAEKRGVTLSAVSIAKGEAVRKVAKHARVLTDIGSQ